MAYLGFYFGGGEGWGGVQNILEKWGYLHLHGYVLYCMLGGVRGYAPPRKFKKWCTLVRFGEDFVKIL